MVRVAYVFLFMIGFLSLCILDVVAAKEEAVGKEFTLYGIKIKMVPTGIGRSRL